MNTSALMTIAITWTGSAPKWSFMFRWEVIRQYRGQGAEVMLDEACDNYLNTGSIQDHGLDNFENFERVAGN